MLWNIVQIAGFDEGPFHEPSVIHHIHGVIQDEHDAHQTDRHEVESTGISHNSLLEPSGIDFLTWDGIGIDFLFKCRFSVRIGFGFGIEKSRWFLSVKKIYIFALITLHLFLRNFLHLDAHLAILISFC
jgi:hypothetical protein